jgi:hypothetical protein
LAEQWLARLGRRAGALDQEEGFEALREMTVAASALVGTGALDRAIAERVVVRLRDDLVALGVVDPDTIAPEPFGDAAPVGPADWGEPSIVPPPRLVRVIPLVRELGPIDGGAAVTLISLEIWNDHLRVRYPMTGRRLRDKRERERWTATLRDDAGTVYVRGGGSGGGDRDTWHEETEFTPVPPPEATMMYFVARRLGPPVDESRRDLPWTGHGAPGEEIVSIEVPLT